MITNRSITTIDDRKEAAKLIHAMGSNYVVLKVGMIPQLRLLWISYMMVTNSSLWRVNEFRLDTRTAQAAPIQQQSLPSLLRAKPFPKQHT